ncbi:Actin cortical patch SUR7/pH-response regulator PalI [Lasiodiplodia theobromae]|uniref:SUR7 family protein pun1 n=2 Tax=Lasiodiplodia TaxID=66739 RepID=A0A5N5D315_9PEZI|nr:Actin cortical patch SUR7 [Lasiodiplodia theobromae]KAB2571714.1 hypothetical protein DBV05_g9617 [Lasiodiplodia theobromae]KAF4538982.1 Actin cortical patch SUR7 [Lasiodiplodia theobromae]KAF9637329.1 Actin cortical patch SUR7/pH-response regulator PalI [Lasiodiplodia theobromae]KAK0654067.1 hypothetical protein DIS24_g5483 [Lasiodiplodia hormozganensis]
MPSSPPSRTPSSRSNGPVASGRTSATATNAQDAPRGPHFEETPWNTTPGGGLKRSNTTLSKKQMKRATRTRKIFAVISSFFFFLSALFLLLVEIGNTHNKPVLRDTWFMKLDLSHIVPTSIPNATLLNSIAQTLGLHDFYQVGLWNFCEGYINEGVTECSHPETLYWFNPVEILLNELFAGATIAIPEEALTYLDILKVASQWMFGLFLTGTCLSTLLIFLTPLSVYTRWAAGPIAILSLFTLLCIFVACIIATAIFIVFKIALTQVEDLNIKAVLGAQMFGFMWTSAGCILIAFIIQSGLCCCCASRRDVRTGRKLGSKKAYTMPPDGDPEKQTLKQRLGFGRNKA